MVNRQAQYGQNPNRITDIETYLSLGASLKELERYVTSFGRALTDNERRLQQTLPGMIKTFERIEKEYRASNTGKLTSNQAADLKVMFANKELILKWLNQLTKFNPTTNLARNSRNDQSFIYYATILNDIMQKMTSSMEHTYKESTKYFNSIAAVRKKFGLPPMIPTTAQPPANTGGNGGAQSKKNTTQPTSALSRPFPIVPSPNIVKDYVSALDYVFTSFFQNLHKTFSSTIIVNHLTGALKKVSDAYIGGVALQKSGGDLSKISEQFKERAEEITRMIDLQNSVANAGANLRSKYSGYNYQPSALSNIADPTPAQKFKQKSALHLNKLGATATKIASVALKAIPIVGAIATGVSIIFKQMKKSSPVLQAVSNIFELAWNLLWMPLGNALGTFLLPMAEDLINFAILFNEIFTDFSLEKLMELYYAVMQLVWGAAMDLISAIPRMIIDGAFNMLIGLFDFLGWDGAVSVLEQVRDFIFNGFNFVRNLPINILDGLKTLIKGITDFFTNPVEKIKQAVSGIFGGGDIGEKAKSGRKSTANNLLGWTGLKFATGGVVTGPTIAMIGEAGPEAVIPLDKAAGLGATYVININGDVYGVSDLESRIERVIQRTANKAYYR